MKEIVCYYHADCLDGAVAAAAVCKLHKYVACMPMNYDDEPKAQGKDLVYIVDFSFYPDTLRKLCKDNGAVILIDHHGDMCKVLEEMSNKPKNLELVLDPRRSGGWLTWERLHGEVPGFVRIANDFDLFNYEAYDSTDAICTGFMDIYSLSPIALSDTIPVIGQEGLKRMERQGGVIINATVKLARSCINAGYEDPKRKDVLYINAPRHLISRIVHEMSRQDQYTLLVIYQILGPEKVKYSLRSYEDAAEDFTALRVAKAWGGSGHKHAASFYTNIFYPTLF